MIKRLTLIFNILLLASLVSLGQKYKLNNLQGCQNEWKYKDLQNGFSGTIVFFEQPVVMCGVLSTASVALIKKDNGDTIRVLTMCNVKKDFNESPTFSSGEKVFITPSAKPSFKVDIMPVDFASCRLKTAYFGIIRSAK